MQSSTAEGAEADVDAEADSDADADAEDAAESTERPPSVHALLPADFQLRQYQAKSQARSELAAAGRKAAAAVFDPRRTPLDTAKLERGKGIADGPASRALQAVRDAHRASRTTSVAHAAALNIPLPHRARRDDTAEFVPSREHAVRAAVELAVRASSLNDFAAAEARAARADDPDRTLWDEQYDAYPLNRQEVDRVVARILAERPSAKFPVGLVDQEARDTAVDRKRNCRDLPGTAEETRALQHSVASEYFARKDVGGLVNPVQTFYAQSPQPVVTERVDAKGKTRRLTSTNALNKTQRFMLKLAKHLRHLVKVESRLLRKGVSWNLLAPHGIPAVRSASDIPAAMRAVRRGNPFDLVMLPTILCPLHKALVAAVDLCCDDDGGGGGGDDDDDDGFEVVDHADPAAAALGAAAEKGEEDLLKTLQRACGAALEQGKQPGGKLRQNSSIYGPGSGKHLLSKGGPLTTGAYLSRALAFIHQSGLQHRVLIHRQKLAMDIYQMGVVVYVSKCGGDAGGISDRLLGSTTALKTFMDHAMNTSSRRSGHRMHVLDAAGRIAFADAAVVGSKGGPDCDCLQWSLPLGSPPVRGLAEAPYFAYFYCAPAVPPSLDAGCVAAGSSGGGVAKKRGPLKRIYVVATERDLLRCQLAFGNADDLFPGAKNAAGEFATLRAAEFPGLSTDAEIVAAADAQYHCGTPSGSGLARICKPTLMMKGVVTVLEHALAIFSPNEAADVLGISKIPVQTRRLLARHLRSNNARSAEQVWDAFRTSGTSAADAFLGKASAYFSKFTREQIGVRAWKWLLMSDWAGVDLDPESATLSEVGDGVPAEALAAFRVGKVPEADASPEVLQGYQALVHSCAAMVACSSEKGTPLDGTALAVAPPPTAVVDEIQRVYGADAGVAEQYAKCRFLVQHAFRRQPGLEELLVKRSRLTSSMSLAVLLHMLTEAETTMALNTDVGCQKVFEAVHGRKWRIGAGYAKLVSVAQFLTCRVRYGHDEAAYREARSKWHEVSDDWVSVASSDGFDSA